MQGLLQALKQADAGRVTTDITISLTKGAGVNVDGAGAARTGFAKVVQKKPVFARFRIAELDNLHAP